MLIALYYYTLRIKSQQIFKQRQRVATNGASDWKK